MLALILILIFVVVLVLFPSVAWLIASAYLTLFILGGVIGLVIALVPK